MYIVYYIHWITIYYERGIILRKHMKTIVIVMATIMILSGAGGVIAGIMHYKNQPSQNAQENFRSELTEEEIAEIAEGLSEGDMSEEEIEQLKEQLRTGGVQVINNDKNSEEETETEEIDKK